MSVIIAAHNEERVIGRCLGGVLAERDSVDLDVIVVANGCTDDTARVAEKWGVTVIDRPEPGKAAALNAGEAVARYQTRVYLDADVVLAPGSLPAMARALAGQDGPRVLAVMPRRHMNLAGRSLAVKAYYAINTRLPIFDDALFGRGAIGVSAEGRERYDGFPLAIADDMYLDSLFAPAEKREVQGARSTVQAPMRTKDLVRTLARVRAGNNHLRASHAGVRASNRSSWLRDVVLPRPWLAPAAAVYVGITLRAAMLARKHSPSAWGRDESTR
jgi:glycosyltransferase involved in cell wall biosynthesis